MITGQPCVIHSSPQAFHWHMWQSHYLYLICVFTLKWFPSSSAPYPLHWCSATHSFQLEAWIKAQHGRWGPSRWCPRALDQTEAISTPSDRSQPSVQKICPHISASAPPWDYCSTSCTSRSSLNMLRKWVLSSSFSSDRIQGFTYGACSWADCFLVACWCR